MTIHSEQVTLFVVEDDDIDYMTIKRSFNSMKIGNPIVRAQDGKEAFDMMINKEIQTPFIMLLDLQMPRVSGIELLTKIRQTPNIKDTVIFVLTSSADEKDIVSSYQHNVAGYFVKDEVGKEFLEILYLLNGYWKIVHIPKEM
jgi:CheY-like chemotaxis protein